VRVKRKDSTAHEHIAMLNVEITGGAPSNQDVQKPEVMGETQRLNPGNPDAIRIRGCVYHSRSRWRQKAKLIRF
jgi:hypothetical protein